MGMGSDTATWCSRIGEETSKAGAGDSALLESEYNELTMIASELTCAYRHSFTQSDTVYQSSIY
jgi:hypothetical protein